MAGKRIDLRAPGRGQGWAAQAGLDGDLSTVGVERLGVGGRTGQVSDSGWAVCHHFGITACADRAAARAAAIEQVQPFDFGGHSRGFYELRETVRWRDGNGSFEHALLRFEVFADGTETVSFDRRGPAWLPVL